ncbi:RNA polymerase sigma-70 factor [Chitinophaga nivalis]|uniref:RNA polymerase sigma-70 factor n=1 Tax=Chitinophaga nivalis TaxID=2991709 RepID=A0ABT3IH31_9BACT|nr:RNA polymerase sigma-70 factor [Chitinophaga nivalis]MCW3467035.1 RNA polymerase sigma-70 factor [Chitinophaga nivalis]MCW3483274.1 RNA polymerase sigma-70 factor [Chitinophaga nivalis]
MEINPEIFLLCTGNNECAKRVMHQPRSNEVVSFEEQFKLHYVFLCTVAYYVVADEDAARDIVQDFFLYCWNKRDLIRITHDFKSYAVRAIRNASLNYLKKSGKTKLEEIHVIEALTSHFPPEEEGNEEQRNRALWEAVARLPEQRRKIFLMSNRDGLKYKDVATVLGISVNTVKTQIKLALQFLRKECGWMTQLIALITLIYDRS